MELSVIRGGLETSVSDGNPFWLVEQDGLGMAELHRLNERGPLQHGDSDLGYRLDPRFVTLVVGVLAETPGEVWDLRKQLLDCFRPGAGALILKCTLENGDVRQLDGFYYSGLTMPTSDREGAIYQKAGMVVKAPDPTLYDPSAHSEVFELGGGTDVLEVPMEVPMVVGASTIDAAKSIYYAGTAESLPFLIRITGPIDDCVITNETTGEKLDFTGAAIDPGDYYDIDLRYGYKQVVDSTGASKLAELTTDSDLATWHFAPEPEAPDGLNNIRVQGSNVDPSTRIAISFFDRYIGV